MKTKLFSSLLFISLFLVCIGVCSCSDSEPGIGSVYYSVVYEFSDMTSPYECYLSVYISPSSDGRRLESMKVMCESDGYTWHIDNPEQFENGKNTYYGCSKLSFVDDKLFPEGRYVVKYTDMSDREAESSFRLRNLSSMNNSKRKITANDVNKRRNGSECTVKKIAVLDKDDKELFFGPWDEFFDSSVDVRGVFPGAESYQLIYSTRDNSSVIIMPKQKF